MYQQRLFTNHPSSVSVHCKSKFLLAHLLLFTVCQKMFPLFCSGSKSVPPEFSHCCQRCKDLLFSWIWSNRVCNKLEPAFMEKTKQSKQTKKKPKQCIFLAFGPWHKYYFRPNRSTRCFLPELQNVQRLWEARVWFPLHELECVRRSKMRDGSQDEKNSCA